MVKEEVSIIKTKGRQLRQYHVVHTVAIVLNKGGKLKNRVSV
jgi:hypothetical protein